INLSSYYVLHLSSCPHSSFDHRLLRPSPTRRSSDLLLASTDPVDGHVEYHGNYGAIERTIGPGVLLQVNQDGGVLEHVLEVLARSEEHTSELQSRENLVCRLLLDKKNKDWISILIIL